MTPPSKSRRKKTNLKKPLKVKLEKSYAESPPETGSMLDNWIKKEELTDEESSVQSVSITGFQAEDPAPLQNQKSNYKTRGASNKPLLYINLIKLEITDSNQPESSTTEGTNTFIKTEIKTENLQENEKTNGKIFIRLKNKTLKCIKCDYTHAHQHGLKTHFDKNHNTNVYKCKQCPFKTKQQYYFNAHTKVHLKPDLECPYCQKMIKQFSYKTHIKVHERNDQTEYKCDFCDYRSYNHYNVKRHSLTHMDYTDLTHYKCDVCDYVSVDKGRLKCHQRTHTQEGKRRHCPQCDFSTRYPAHLRRHLLNSHGERNVQCSLCPRMFTSELNVKGHMQRTHADESEKRYFYCEMCLKETPYKTTEKANLVRHMLVHRPMDEVELFACHKCPYLGETRALLKHHLAKVHL